MTLVDAIRHSGMTPPENLPPGRWVRFPGNGKGKSNRSGWCRVITPTVAIFGDWSTGLSETWYDETFRDDEKSRRLIQEAKERERQFAAQQAKRALAVESEAAKLVREAITAPHPYLAAKGFKRMTALVHGSDLIVPVRAAENYSRLISLQRIANDGMKRFLTGGRTKGGIYRLGAPGIKTLLCEGFATGLTLQAAMRLLPHTHQVIVCFSANNLVNVAQRFPKALVCADNDESNTGEEAARKTGLAWIMPPEKGSDFNDLHLKKGLHAVVEVLRVH